jgi:O-antigen/teichoic acid export membrane protein
LSASTKADTPGTPPAVAETVADEKVKSYGRGAAILSVGIGVTGLVTYAYFSLASHSLSSHDYGGITLLWSTIFIVVSILYRPVEQLLSRTISDRDVRGHTGHEHLRVAITIQLSMALLFLVAALIARHPLQDNLLGGSETLYWVLIGAVLGYAASYFARGFLAGHRRFGLYGGLVFMEAMSRFMFAFVVAVGIASGQSVVALGMVAAPLLSLSVVPWAIGRSLRRSTDPDRRPDDALLAAELDAASAGEPMAETGPGGEPEFTLSHGTGFAAAVLLIMISEQTFLNAGPLLVKATEGAQGAAIAGFVFNALLIARAPLQLFQAIQTSILPSLTRMAVSGEADPFRRSVRLTLAAIAVFGACVALGFLILGPWLMNVLFGGSHHYGRVGLVIVAVGMGVYLSAATLNQAALAQARSRQAAMIWLATALLFVAFLAIPWGFDDRVLQVEVGYLGAATVLCSLLYMLYRRPVTVAGTVSSEGHEQ